MATAQTRNDAAPEVAELLLAEVAKLGSAPASAEELAARQATLTGAYGRALETTQGLARTLSTYALQDIPLGEITRYADQVRAVTAQDEAAFAADALGPAQADVIVVGDAKLFLDALKAKLPNLEVIPAADLDLDSPTLRKPGR